ncbi:hypothetical protein M8J76_004459 [Diaphorina citri]|nr:hypothetical protein M8J75_011868 [Diaphorina citri]KAI5740502.1 hypothetical protein M8J76_004459 [Diaphorina citri]
MNYDVLFSLGSRERNRHLKKKEEEKLYVGNFSGGVQPVAVRCGAVRCGAVQWLGIPTSDDGYGPVALFR